MPKKRKVDPTLAELLARTNEATLAEFQRGALALLRAHLEELEAKPLKVNMRSDSGGSYFLKFSGREHREILAFARARDITLSQALIELLRIGLLTRYAQQVLGSSEKASEWMQRPNQALGGATPSSLLSDSDGFQRVDAVLTRIEHGVFS